ncbi:hypothetical protein BH23BAC1_BH23BAC1_46930 [soil metagenome]
MNSITIFFNKIKELTLWQRIFSWKAIRSLSYDAYQEVKMLEERLNNRTASLDSYQEKCRSLEIEIRHVTEKMNEARDLAMKQESIIDRLQEKISDLGGNIGKLRNKITSYENAEERNKKDHELAMEKMFQAQQSFEQDVKRLQDEKLAEKEAHFAAMKLQWSDHENTVKQTIRSLCDRHIIPYIEKVPFKGNPDNTIEICGEYVIFDAKCPANDNYDHFPSYVKSQAEAAKKYARQEKVKRDVFLVIPSTTVEKISQWTYNMGDYNVFVITKDALEPVILALKKIEDYEFVNQLTPEERENISRVIGKFAHTTKRRIQIDQFFANQFLDILRKCEVELPEDFIRQVVEFEKAEKLNPPTEKRAKQILVNELSDKHAKTNAEAHLRDLEIPGDFEEIRNWA